MSGYSEMTEVAGPDGLSMRFRGRQHGEVWINATHVLTDGLLTYEALEAGWSLVTELRGVTFGADIRIYAPAPDARASAATRLP